MCEAGAEQQLAGWKRALNMPFVVVILFYRATLSHLMGGQCRYNPTCSQYRLDAYRMYGPIKGTRLTLGRSLRCHPFVKGGYDPVPIPDSDTDCLNDDEKRASSQ